MASFACQMVSGFVSNVTGMASDVFERHAMADNLPVDLVPKICVGDLEAELLSASPAVALPSVHPI